MNRRRRRPPPPDDAESMTGTGIEFKPEDDLLRQLPDPPHVILTAGGTAMALVDFELVDSLSGPTLAVDPEPPLDAEAKNCDE